MLIGTDATSFTIDGRRATYAGLDAFRLLDKQLRAQAGLEPFDLDGLLADYKSVMVETWPFPFLRVLRVFCMAQSFMQLKPSDYANYYTTVSFLSDYVFETFGFVIQWECLADCVQSGMDLAARQEHVRQMGAALNGRPALLSLGNEHSKNGWSPDEHERPQTSVLCSKGSDVGDANPPTPPWEFSLYHGRRDGIKCFLSSGDLAFATYGYPGWPGTQGPTIHDEPIGFAEVSKPGSRASNPQVAHQLGFNASICGAGGTYHADDGVETVPFQPVQKAGALAFMMALSKADPAQRWNGVM